jgi:transcriptional regulator with XRE-family HTH domain
MRSSDLLVTGRRRAGLSQDELAGRLGRPQSTIARWGTGQQHPPLESVIEALRACGLELTVGIARYDDSYDAQIARQLRLDPTERVRRLTPAWATEGFDPIAALAELAGQARFVVIGDVAAALHGSPVMLGARTLHVVPAETALRRIEQTARRLDAQPSAEGTAQTQRWTLPTGGELRVTPLPPGTRGYRDLARDAETMQIAPSTSVRVASLLDLIRIAEASPDAGARASVPALWATLETHQRPRRREHVVEQIGRRDGRARDTKHADLYRQRSTAPETPAGVVTSASRKAHPAPRSHCHCTRGA